MDTRKKSFFLALVFLGFYVAVVFRPFFFEGKLPIPADTIVGLYHPWRDRFAKEYPAGIPFKNFLITDPVRQHYVWRKQSVENLKEGVMPFWNWYSFSGTPHLANPQAGTFYPLNVLYLLPVAFEKIWSWQIVLQPILGGIFMFWYLRHLGVGFLAATLGLLSWVGSGFWVSWMEWNSLVHVGLWLPLVLLATDKVFFTKRKLLWSLVLAVALGSSFLAGHWQIFFYVAVSAVVYTLARLYQSGSLVALKFLVLSCVLFFIFCGAQIMATARFITESGRDIDQTSWAKEGWFLPWQNLGQFFAPDFFGNPATLNYFGVWNYQEFVGYFGVGGLVAVLLAIFYRRDRKTVFFGLWLLSALVFALPTPLSKLPFELGVPFVATSQPTRLMVLVDFSLAVLGALGFDYFLREKDKRRLVAGPLVFLGTVFVAMWLIAWRLDFAVSIRNLVVPTGLFLVASVLLAWGAIWPRTFLVGALLYLAFLVIDLSRFAVKFESFSPAAWLFPQTEVIEFFAQKARGSFRVAALDDRIFAPNFSVAYGLEFVSGYDPLYLRRYGELAAVIEGDGTFVPDKLPFNRIITVKNYRHKLFSLLGVSYLLTLYDVDDPAWRLVFSEGETKVYEVEQALPFAYFAKEVRRVKNREEALSFMLSEEFKPPSVAVVEGELPSAVFSPTGAVRVRRRSSAELVLETDNANDGFLVLSLPFYSGWKGEVSGKKLPIYPTNYAFSGTVVPGGRHIVRFSP